MDHDLIVEQLLAQCKCFIENILQATDLHSVATASLAIFAQMRQVGRKMLQAKIDLEAQQLKGTQEPVKQESRNAVISFPLGRHVSSVLRMPHAD